MRYLHPVQAHEKFVASGVYHFSKDDQALDKSEAWTIHEQPDGERFIRVDVDSRRAEGKSILVEALQGSDGRLARLDIRYENSQFEDGIKYMQASYQVADERLQVGFNLNGGERQYLEVALPYEVLFDIPLLIFRGATIKAMAGQSGPARPIFVPMYEHAQLFPGALRTTSEAVDFAGEDSVVVGKQQIPVRRYRYRDRAAAYWIDRHGVIIKRVNAYRQQEIVVKISNYAPPPV